MGLDLSAWWNNEQGTFPDWNGKSTTNTVKNITGAGENEGWFPGNQTQQMQDVKDGVGGVVDKGVAGVQNAYNSVKDSATESYNNWAGEPEAQGDITDFDMNDKESVMALQERLGVKADGMFGPKTEAAYRQAVDGQRQDEGQESLRYDYNEGGPAAKTKLGGFLKNAYQNVDQKLGGVLPGGYKKGQSSMTADEYANQ